MDNEFNKKLNLVINQILQWHKDFNENGNPTKAPLFIGISGSQGSGKTTLNRELVKTLTSDPYNLSIVNISLDDLYLTNKEQVDVSNRNIGNELLKYRGNAGTHDIDMGKEIFNELKNKASKVTIPRYNKALKNGRGDRAPKEEWQVAFWPYDIVIFEGWLFGFKALECHEIEKILPTTKYAKKYPLNHVLKINENLKRIEELWYPYFDAFIHISNDHLENVYSWRLEQEEELRKKVGDPNAGLTKEQVFDFVDRFMASYELYLPQLNKEGFFNPPNKKHLKLIIDSNRKLLSNCLI